MQSPPTTSGSSAAPSSSRTRPAIARRPANVAGADHAGLGVARCPGSAPRPRRRQRAPSRSSRPAARNAAGACSSPRPAPEQSIGASRTRGESLPSRRQPPPPPPSGRARSVEQPAQDRRLARVGAEVRGTDHGPGAHPALGEAGGGEGGEAPARSGFGRQPVVDRVPQERAAGRTRARPASASGRSPGAGRRRLRCCDGGSRRGPASRGRGAAIREAARARAGPARCPGRARAPVPALQPRAQCRIADPPKRLRRRAARAARPTLNRDRSRAPPPRARRSVGARIGALEQQRPVLADPSATGARRLAVPERQRLGLVGSDSSSPGGRSLSTASSPAGATNE